MINIKNISDKKDDIIKIIKDSLYLGHNDIKSLIEADGINFVRTLVGLNIENRDWFKEIFNITRTYWEWYNAYDIYCIFIDELLNDTILVNLMTGETIGNKSYSKIKYLDTDSFVLTGYTEYVELFDIKSGNFIITSDQEYTSISSDVYGYYLVGQEQRYGLCDVDGKLIIPITYNLKIKTERDFLVAISSSYNYNINQQESSYTLYDKKGNVLLDNYEYILTFKYRGNGEVYVKAKNKSGTYDIYEVCENNGGHYLYDLYNDVYLKQITTGNYIISKDNIKFGLLTDFRYNVLPMNYDLIEILPEHNFVIGKFDNGIFDIFRLNTHWSVAHISTTLTGEYIKNIKSDVYYKIGDEIYVYNIFDKSNSKLNDLL